MREQTLSTNVVYYLHADHLGSASLTTDSSGNKVSELRYLPYGDVRYVWNRATPTDRRFTGQRAENGLGSLYDYGARHYSPYLGRFLSADTLVPSPQNPQSLNRYSYVLGNPLRYTDPSGHCIACVIVAGAVAVGVILIGVGIYLSVKAPESLTVSSPTSAPPTSEATSIPQPTSTLRPTYTPQPTNTPMPTPAPNSTPDWGSVFGPGVGYKKGWGLAQHPVGDPGVDLISANDPHYATITGGVGGLWDSDPEGDSRYTLKQPGRIVYAVVDGYFGWGPSDDGSGCSGGPCPPQQSGAGFQIISNDGRFKIDYIHVTPVDGLGTTVKAGQPIGYYSQRGRSSIPHLHIRLREKINGAWIDFDPY